MNIADINHQIEIAKAQAVISQKKMDWYAKHGQEYTAKVYRTRMNALNCYVETLKKKLKDHTRKQFKRQSA